MTTKDNDAAKFCPHCGSCAGIMRVAEWHAVSKDDPDNECDLDEYQCHGDCEGKSFWV